MTDTQNGAGNWNLKQELSPSLFTDNYLLKHSNGSQIILREVNNLFLQKLSKNDGQVQKYLEEATLSHENYSKIFLNRKENSIKGEIWRSYSESSGINFFSLLKKIKSQRIEENHAKYFLLQILEIIEKLHQNNVFYLTLRQEDLFLHDGHRIKLADYSLANAVLKSYSNLEWVKTLNMKCFAPEINSELCICDKSEIFNLGVLLFSMVVGGRPFSKMDSSCMLYRFISNKEDDKYWAYVEKGAKKRFSSEFKDLVFKMLAIDYRERISIEQIRIHKFLNNSDDMPRVEEIKMLFNGILRNEKAAKPCVKMESKVNSNTNLSRQSSQKQIEAEVKALIEGMLNQLFPYSSNCIEKNENKKD
jgi:serine/threonine protein kinase